MKRIRTTISIFTILAILFACTPLLIAMDSADNGQHTGDSSEYVMAYYDVATGKETLYTAEDLKNQFSIDVEKIDFGIKSEPQQATEKITETRLSKEEQDLFAEAEKNTQEFYAAQTLDSEIITPTRADTRTLVTNLNAQPYYSIAKLRYTKVTGQNPTTTGNYVGTGFAVGYNLLATARHCLTDNYGNWVTNFNAYFGYNGDANTYTNLLTNVTGYVYYPQYITGYNSDGTIQTDWNYDIAFIIWGSQTVYQTGCFGMSSDTSVGSALITAGYPGDLSSGLRMYRDTGSVSSLTSTRLSTSGITAAGGQSGSPLYNSSFYAHGVLTHGDASGRRIDGTLIQWLIAQGYV